MVWRVGRFHSLNPSDTLVLLLIIKSLSNYSDKNEYNINGAIETIWQHGHHFGSTSLDNSCQRILGVLFIYRYWHDHHILLSIYIINVTHVKNVFMNFAAQEQFLQYALS